MTDLTSLNSTDASQQIFDLLGKANDGILNTKPAAVCVYSNFASELAALNPTIKKAVVAGFFPESQASLEQKKNELIAISEFAIDEVDIVINRGKLIEGDYDFLSNEIRQARKILSNKTLKVILETGELSTDQIAAASRIAIEEAADFIKTSTGKSKTGATEEAVETMCQIIAESNSTCGIKVSGGIRTIDDALIYQNIVLRILGEKWLYPERLRFGASSLFDNIKKELIKHD
ncbi:MAG: deoxyribose-phosphate aldolase [Crocinitomicaceae bacterium]